MALSFPPRSHRLAEIIDPAHVAEVAARAGELPTLAEAKARGRRISDPAVRRIFSMVLLADGTLAMVSVGRRGGHRIEWKFGRV